MKFLSKNPNSAILQEGLTYKKGNAENNSLLKDKLKEEQKNFCAYTEKYLQPLESVEIEHFNPSIKYKDDYFNYYAVIRRANLYKKDEKFRNASFFETKFFQKKDDFNSRIKFKENIYYNVVESDTESIDFIEFLGLNHHDLYSQREKHVNRLLENFEKARFDKTQQFEYFREHLEELSFITAIEDKLGLNLETIL